MTNDPDDPFEIDHSSVRSLEELVQRLETGAWRIASAAANESDSWWRYQLNNLAFAHLKAARRIAETLRIAPG